ncbi:MAG: cadherin repeat domain-containing protein [Cyanobacteria bacterium J06598_1]
MSSFKSTSGQEMLSKGKWFTPWHCHVHQSQAQTQATTPFIKRAISPQKLSIAIAALPLVLGLSACQRATEQGDIEEVTQPTVLNTAEVYEPNELTIVAPTNTLPGNSTLIQVAENSANVIQVRAQDVPGSKLIYRLQDGADMEKFEMNEETGDLTFKEVPDWENPTDENKDNNYMVLWQVVSSSGSARSQFVVVKVTDLSD